MITKTKFYTGKDQRSPILECIDGGKCNKKTATSTKTKTDRDKKK